MILSWLSALLSRDRNRGESPQTAPPARTAVSEPAAVMAMELADLQAGPGETPAGAEATAAQAAADIPVLPPLDDPGVDEVDDDLLATFREEAPVDTATSLLAGSVESVDTQELVQDLRSLMYSL